MERLPSTRDGGATKWSWGKPSNAPRIADSHSGPAVPEPVGSVMSMPGSCALYGQAYIAGTSIGEHLAENESVKVLCIKSTINAKNIG